MHPQDSNSVELGANTALEAASHRRGIAFILLANVQAGWEPGGLAGMRSEPQHLGPWGRGARGQEIKAVGPRVPSRCRGRAVFAHLQPSPFTLAAHLPSPPAAFPVPFL